MRLLLQSDDHAVAVAGGLEEGDLILDVNGQNMEGVTYDRYSFLCCDLSSSARHSKSPC